LQPSNSSHREVVIPVGTGAAALAAKSSLRIIPARKVPLQTSTKVTRMRCGD
jgi:hypothetical protein